jgi:hypothetical protein
MIWAGFISSGYELVENFTFEVLSFGSHTIVILLDQASISVLDAQCKL